MLRRVLGVTTAGGTAACAYAYYEAKRRMGADAVERIIAYDLVVVPAIIEYKWLEAKCEKLPKFVPWLFPPVTDEEERAQFEVLHRKWARPVFDIFMQLGGFYYKSGQKIAANTAGVVPDYYVDMFQPFLNNIPPRNITEVRSVMEADFGQPVSAVFSEFDETPIGWYTAPHHTRRPSQRWARPSGATVWRCHSMAVPQYGHSVVTTCICACVRAESSVFERRCGQRVHRANSPSSAAQHRRASRCQGKQCLTVAHVMASRGDGCDGVAVWSFR